MTELKSVLMKRDNISSEEADELIKDARITLDHYIDTGDTEAAHNICEEFFGLEPDYIFDLMD